MKRSELQDMAEGYADNLIYFTTCLKRNLRANNKQYVLLTQKIIKSDSDSLTGVIQRIYAGE